MTTTYKVLGQAAPAADTDTTLYTVPASRQAVISTLIVANRFTSIAGFTIAVRPAGAALSNEHYIAFGVAVGALDSTTITLGITLGETDVVTVSANNANLSFSLFGSEIAI